MIPRSNHSTKPGQVQLALGPRNEALLKELKAHVKAQAGAWKYPRWIEALTELPKTATGIQRFKLRERG